MGLKETVRNGMVLSLVTFGVTVCGRSDGDEVLLRTQGPAATPTPTPVAERQADADPTDTLTPLITEMLTESPSSSPTDEPTPEPTPFVLLPLPTARPTPAPTAIVIIEQTPQPTPEIIGQPRPDWAPRLIELANQKRAELGLVALSQDQDLTDSGQNYTQFLVTNGLYGHCHDESPQKRGNREGYVGGVGEVLGAANSPEEAFQRWMDSARHRAALEYPGVRHIGIGAYQGRFTTIFTVEVGDPSITSWHECD